MSALPSSSSLPLPDAAFGRSLRSHWLLDDRIHYLNHGAFGATPKHVLEAQTRWRETMERDPTHFMVELLPEALRAVIDRLAPVIGTTASQLALVENATAGVNAVLRSIRWQAGDRIVIANHAYPGVKAALRYVADRHDLTIVEAQVPWPLSDAAALIDAYDKALKGDVRLAIVDHVFSPLAIVTPVESVVDLCRARGIPVLVDGAHAPGMLPLTLDALGADWYVGNCHKWLCAPKGCAFLMATPEAQHDLHPAVVSSYYGKGFAEEFGWPGTVDPTARLALPAALDFIEALGVNRYTTALREQARAAAEMLATAWHIEPGAPPDLFGAMVTLPFPVNEAGTETNARRWQKRLYEEHRIEVPVLAIENRLWVRISAQVYNELEDFQQLAGAPVAMT